ncbi:MAG TPA: FtsW/RodA/SpoVE family cell cycle protein [Thermomicrobiaceae bacterium]|nr:FtsW/RodA/SpoVE family cell cycle protein [Thermomicrobiaceae bacterium]
MGTLITSLQGHRRASGWRAFDPYIVVTSLVLIGFGLVAIWSADSTHSLSPNGAAGHQVLYLLLGIPLMLGLASLDYRYIKTFAWVIYAGTLALLGLVLVVGSNIGGSTRWFKFGPITIQPSEIAKLAVIIALAAFIADRGEEMDRLVNYVLAAAVVGIPAVLVYQQPDLGTAGVFAFVWLIMLLMSRTRLLYLFGTLVAAVPAGFVAWHFVVHSYMRQRLLISYDPQSDPLGAGFNIIQAQLSIGSSGLFGHGLAGSLESQLNLLGVRTTDFIFAHAMGMFGFFGALALFVTYLILLWRTLHVARVARDEFGQILAIGITAMIFFQAFVNMGMNIGLMPVTGIPLPFVSAGGSSLWTLLASIGLLQSVLIHQQRLGFQPD